MGVKQGSDVDPAVIPRYEPQRGEVLESHESLNKGFYGTWRGTPVSLTVSFTSNAFRSDRGQHDSASHNYRRNTPMIGILAHINVISFFMSNKKLMLLDPPIREKNAQSQAD